MTSQTPKVALWWIRRDLRLADNQALVEALNYAEVVIPVFIVDPILWASSKAGDKRKAFLLEGLRRLDESLHVRASALIVRIGNPIVELPKLVEETKASIVFAEEDYSPYARRRDEEVSKQISLRLTPGLTIHHPAKVVKSDGTPYTIFTPFSKAWKSLPPPLSILPAPHRIPTPIGIPRDELPPSPLPSLPGFPAGENEAQLRLGAFIRGTPPLVHDYHHHRDRPDLNATSSLSPYIRFGMVSVRHVTLAALKLMQRAPSTDARKGLETWLNEIIWREFFQAILFHFPHVHQRSFRDELQNIPWHNDPDLFQAWCTGQTGYPIVDAAMRQLIHSGWMHNRARMIAASFLTKDLLIDWRWGEKWFMQHLIDGDLAANNGGWQWSAGTGTDAHPYFRVFNPVLQGKKFDPHGNYVRQWVPELRSLSAEDIHTPWEMPLDAQKRAGVLIGTHYPAPIIDHAWARERALEAYGRAKNNH
ncbi:MAG: deoxyribodipyrimidine photo-lyase [Anaerolineales bacterium]